MMALICASGVALSEEGKEASKSLSASLMRVSLIGGVYVRRGAVGICVHTYINESPSSGRKRCETYLANVG